MPNPVEFCSLKPVEEIISQSKEDELDLSSFEALGSQLPSILSQWHQRVTNMLCEELQKPIPLRITFDSDSEDDYEYGSWDGSRKRSPRTRPSPLGRLSVEHIRQRLLLATTVLTCKQCYDPFFGKWENGPFAIPDEDDERYLVNSMPLFFPQVLKHKYCNSINILHENNPGLIFQVRELERSSTAFFPSQHEWTSTPLRLDVSLSTHASHLLSLIDGFNPRTTTVEMMDNRNARYICLSNQCTRRKDFSKRNKTGESEASLNMCPMFDWRSAVRI